MKHLGWALFDEGGAARARGLPVGALLHPLNSGQTLDMEIEQLQAVIAVAPLIPRLHFVAASGADVIAQPLWMIDIEPVTTHPAFIYLDVKMTVINHMSKTALVTDHRPPPFLVVCCYRTGTYTV